MTWFRDTDGPAKIIDRTTGAEIPDVVWADDKTGEYHVWIMRRGCPEKCKRRGSFVILLLRAEE